MVETSVGVMSAKMSVYDSMAGSAEDLQSEDVDAIVAEGGAMVVVVIDVGGGAVRGRGEMREEGGARREDAVVWIEEKE